MVHSALSDTLKRRCSVRGRVRAVKRETFSNLLFRVCIEEGRDVKFLLSPEGALV